MGGDARRFRAGTDSMPVFEELLKFFFGWGIIADLMEAASMDRSLTLDIVLASVKSIVSLLVSVSVGAGCAYSGIIDVEVMGRFSKLSYYVFLPCLIFYTIGNGISVSQMKYAWPLILIPTVIQVINFFLGNVLCIILRIPPSFFRRVVILSLMFSNYGNFPYSIIHTISTEVWPLSADPSNISRGLAYSTLFLSNSGTTLWSFGPWYLSKYKSSGKSGAEAEERVESSASSSAFEELMEVDADGEYAAYSDPVNQSNFDGNFVSTSVFGKISSAVSVCVSFLKRIVTPSLISVIISLTVLFIDPVHKVFFSANTATAGSETDEKPPLGFITSTVSSFANLCIPIALMVLGADLYRTIRTQITNYRLRRESSEVVLFGGLSWKILVSIVFTRLVLLPILYSFLTWLLLKPIFKHDPMLLMVVVIETSMPSAVNLVILTHLLDISNITEKLSTIILFQYLFCTVTILITIIIGMKIFVV